MSIYIYNTLTRKKEEFKPQNPSQINMYTCGVTVYDQCHIGHARSLYIFDMIRRYLEYRKFKVNFVRNITDVDDKIINRANELNIDWKELVGRYIDSYKKDLESLSIQPGIVDGDGQEPRATKNISDMIKYIEGLIVKGYAYATDSGVYFSVRKFKDYGKLSGQSIDQMLSGVRIEADEHKQDSLDFALWKRSKSGEPSWPSPWGDGRPGWHIECSVMSQKFLKVDTLDIHAGGRDLIFPHHENEIAQSEALTGKTFAKCWIHHGLLTINGQKMAKSLGNFITIKDVLNRYPADRLKIFYLQAHYSRPVDFSWDRMEEARLALERIMILKEKIARLLVADSYQLSDKKISQVESIKNNFIESMDDDFNAPQALATIFELVNVANKNINNLDFLHHCQQTLGELLSIFGISLKAESAFREKLTIEEKNMIEERERTRKEKNYALSDKIRKELEEKGIILEDTKEGITWRRR